MAEKTIFEQTADKVAKIISEQKQVISWSPEMGDGKTIKEMIGTGDGATEFIEKTTYDVFQGRESVPLLYKDIYSTITDRNLPKALTVEEFGDTSVVFLEHFEGGEVNFGTIEAGTEVVVRLHTWASGLEWSEDMVEYNEYWRATDRSEAMGASYNKLLNHLHLSPIVAGTYVTTGGGVATQKVTQEAGTAQLVAFDTTLAKTLKNALTILPRVTHILINSADEELLLSSLAGDMYADDTAASAKRKIKPSMFIAYDGDSVTVGEQEYTYTGVASGFVYFVVAKRNFKEYVKHDLIVDSDNADLSRLIVDQLVGRTRRGLLAGLGGKYGAVKVDIVA